MSRSVSQFARSLGVDEVVIRSQLNRGYKIKDLELIYAGEDNAAKVAGDAVEASIRRHVRQYGRLPCGEAVRTCNGRSKKSVEALERSIWRAFQFETGTHGDALVGGSEYDPS